MAGAGAVADQDRADQARAQVVVAAVGRGDEDPVQRLGALGVADQVDQLVGAVLRPR